MSKSKPVHLTINCDPELKKEFKLVALKQDKTVTDILLEFIKEYVENNK